MKSALRIYLFSSFIRLLLILISSYVTLIGLDSDAIGFFEKVQLFNWSNFDLFSTDSNIFVVWNHCIMSIFGYSMSLGQILCFFAWSVSYWFFYKTILLYQVTRSVLYAVLIIYCFLPSSVLYSVGFLRESYELMFCNIGVYYFIRFEQRFNILFWFFSLLSFVLATLLHINFVIYIFFILGWPVLRFFLIKRNELFLLIFLILVIYLGNYLFSTEFVVNFLNSHAFGAEVSSDSRANYFNFSEPRSLFLGFLEFHYEPMFRSGLLYQDWIVVIEHILRLVILLRCILKFRILIVLNTAFLFFISGTFAWSLFTYNWGTGIRHHMPQIGMLLILSVTVYNRATHTMDNG